MSILKYHQGSLVQAIKDLFPELQIDEAKFDIAPCMLIF